MLTQLSHIGIAIFLGAYLWLTGRPNATLAYVLIVGAYVFLCKRLHPLDVLLVFIMLLFIDGFIRSEPFKERSKKRKPAVDDEDEEPVDEDDGEADEKFEDAAKDAHLDIGSTWLRAYEKMRPEQVAAMTRDTKELMQTQRELMETLQTMGPAVQQGMDMIDSFKKYFGSGNIAALNPQA